MSESSRGLPCGCIQGYFGCEEAQHLWHRANEAYAEGKRTGRYDEYQDCLTAYRLHTGVDREVQA